MTNHDSRQRRLFSTRPCLFGGRCLDRTKKTTVPSKRQKFCERWRCFLIGFLFFGRFNANLPLRLRDTRLSREIWTRMGDSRFRVTGGLMVRARPLAPQFSAGDPCQILVTHVNLDITHGINLQGDVNGVEIMHIFSELDSH